MKGKKTRYSFMTSIAKYNIWEVYAGESAGEKLAVKHSSNRQDPTPKGKIES